VAYGYLGSMRTMPMPTGEFTSHETTVVGGLGL
jgi:hypothetical protein